MYLTEVAGKFAGCQLSMTALYCMSPPSPPPSLFFFCPLPQGTQAEVHPQMSSYLIIIMISSCFQTPVIALVGNDACWSQIAREQVPMFGSSVGCDLEV